MRRIGTLFILTTLLVVGCGTDIVVQNEVAGDPAAPDAVQQPDGVNLLEAALDELTALVTTATVSPLGQTLSSTS
ncbi:MAG: hypothetical protein HKN26_08190, partial [Acidimicrobiales bacterium]|nr:hypothetical protein [Acidimicrobiales bacterium]